MKRSNRLVLLVGIFLAIVAFVLIAIMLSGGGGSQTPPPSVAPTTTDIVVATRDIDLGATIQSTDVSTREVPIDNAPADSFGDPSFVIGKIARVPVTSGAYISSSVFTTGGAIENIEVPAGHVAIAIQVDQATGVGTIIKPGDFVDVISGFTGPENVPLVIPVAGAGNTVEFIKVTDDLYNHATVKVLSQGLQVLGTLLPPPPTSEDPQATPPPPGEEGETTLSGQQQIVIVAAPAQDAELIKFSQLSGNITLVLRSAEDCTTQPEDGVTFCPVVATTGITLRRAVDDHGVLPPQVVQVLMPSPLPGSAP